MKKRKGNCSSTVGRPSEVRELEEQVPSTVSKPSNSSDISLKHSDGYDNLDSGSINRGMYETATPSNSTEPDHIYSKVDNE